MTLSSLTSTTDELVDAVVGVLDGDFGYAWNPKTTVFTQYLATALSGIGGAVSNLRMSAAQLLAGLANHLGAGPVSHLTSSTDELLAIVGSAGAPEGFAFKLDASGHLVIDGSGQPVLVRIA